jgi:hypothetical protein
VRFTPRCILRYRVYCAQRILYRNTLPPQYILPRIYYRPVYNISWRTPPRRLLNPVGAPGYTYAVRAPRYASARIYYVARYTITSRILPRAPQRAPLRTCYPARVRGAPGHAMLPRILSRGVHRTAYIIAHILPRRVHHHPHILSRSIYHPARHSILGAPSILRYTPRASAPRILPGPRILYIHLTIFTLLPVPARALITFYELPACELRYTVARVYCLAWIFRPHMLSRARYTPPSRASTAYTIICTPARPMVNILVPRRELPAYYARTYIT